MFKERTSLKHNNNKDGNNKYTTKQYKKLFERKSCENGLNYYTHTDRQNRNWAWDDMEKMEKKKIGEKNVKEIHAYIHTHIHNNRNKTMFVKPL